MRFLTLSILLATCTQFAFSDEPAVVAVGKGSYLRGIPPGAAGPPPVIHASKPLQARVPTNDWWSSLAWMPFSERQYPHPLAVQAQSDGLRIFYPGAGIRANRDAIFGFMPADTGDDLTLGLSGQDDSPAAPFPDANVAGYSDWFVSAVFKQGERRLSVSYGHGSPYVFARYSGGRPRIRFANVPEVYSGDADTAFLGLRVNGKAYGLFAPAGARWNGLGSKTLTCETTKDYFSLAILPDDSDETLTLFATYAHAHVIDSNVSMWYRESDGTVSTVFRVATEAHEGGAQGTLMALYPHQWRYSSGKTLDQGYPSVRGRMKLLAGESFRTEHRFPGVLPSLPPSAGCDRELIGPLLEKEIRQEVPPPKDTYWDGKWLGRTATLIPIAEQFDRDDVAFRLRERLRVRLESWLTAADAAGRSKRANVFAYDENWGTLIGYPASFGSDVELNDHHFHYGYFIRAAAEIARHDPQWASEENWGGMVELLVRDVASTRWKSDRLFPFLRNFDPYAGHSWASGHAKFGDGNNNESSSEAMNAWYGMILWGHFTGDKKMRDLGICLYTLEMTAIQEYWFDVHGTNHPPEFTPSVATMIWGGKCANGTWFSANPEVVHGINWLPMHGGSLYLGHYPKYAAKNYAALVEENKDQPWDEWSDLVWMYRALSDSEDALRQFHEGRGTLPLEKGNSLANAYHWIGTISELGQPRGDVTANWPLSAVFDKGDSRTYVVYRSGDLSRKVIFSDGHGMAESRGGFQIESKALP